ncbi:hypothetical protein MMC25_000363 [Agyrium rufum]|nr:hypothetical protein [Agyrium rufum]
MYFKDTNTVAIGLLASLVGSAEAYWRMPCGGTLFTGRLDPIVNPGVVSSHTHVVLGGNAFAPKMNYDDTQKSTCTSCGIQGDFSNYWVPNLWYKAQNGTVTSVPSNGGTVYYQQRVTYPGKKMVAFPEGFRMTAGSPKLTSFSGSISQQAVSYVCLNYNGGGPPQGPAFPTVNCPDGLRAQIYFPSCWDGVNIDSADHQSHVSYPTGSHYDSGVCPDSHPVPLISLFYEFIFNTGDFEWYGSGQPFVLSFGDTTGYGFHGDFINGWDTKILQNGIDNFVTQIAGEADNIYFNNYFQKPAVSGAQCSLPPMVDEEVEGNLDALPGCNPVKGIAATNCANAPTGADVGIVTNAIYTDVTSKGWEYLGCGADQYGNNALTGYREDVKTQTVEDCVATCGGKGFSIAGLEYSSQCFCGNSLPARAQPIPNIVGPCTMPCAGNSSQVCGNGGALSLYQKCSGNCKNAEFGPVGSEGTVGTGAGGSDGDYTGAPPAPTAPAGGASSTVAASPKTTMSTSSKAAMSSSSVSMPKMSHTPVAPIATATSAKTLVVAPIATSTSTPSTGSGSTSSSSVTLPSGWTARGCYSDNLSPRSLTGITFAWWGEAMTSSGCVKYCAGKGYSMAGTEFGGQCFCGNELSKSSAIASTKCNVPCNGAKGEICGGAAALSMFTKSTTTIHKRAHKHRRSGHNIGMAS